jgi:hypothetical protein
MIHSTWVRQCLLISLASACTTHRPVVLSPPVSNRPAISARSDSSSMVAKPELGVYQLGNVRYAFQLKSVVQTALGDSVPRVDSSRLTALVSVNYSSLPQSRLIRGVMTTDSITLSTFSSSASAVALPNQSYSMEVDPLTGKIAVGRTVQPCSQENLEGPFHGDEITPAIPWNSPQFWADTSTYTTCRGGVLLRVTRVSHYHRDSVISSRTTEPLTRVLRAADVAISGTGTQWQQAVQVSGHGVSVDTLLLRTIQPQLYSISGNGKLELVFKSPLRTQHFVQSTTSQVTVQSTAKSP